MWEFSINLKTYNIELSNVIYQDLEDVVKRCKGLLTIHNEVDYIQVLVAVEEKYKNKIIEIIRDSIINIYCDYFKWKFIEKYLSIPLQNKINILAFKKALLNFDKQTDISIIDRNLTLERDIYLESFYFFKLQALRDKWKELVVLSNENKEYLLCYDSFLDLLKFLVDNLDIKQNEISILKSDEGYKILLENDTLYCDTTLSEDNIVSSVIDLSPEKINLFVDENSQAISLLENIFQERIVLNDNFKNIQQIKLK